MIRVSRRLLNDFWQPALVVVIGLIARFACNIFFQEHRVCHFGDAFYFLNTGNSLLALIQQSHSLPEFISRLIAQHQANLEGINSMLSLSLADRLLIDGPVYPAHLALVEWVMKINTQAPVFDSLCLPLSLFNSCVDVVSCLLIYRLGRIAFDKTTGLIAGLIFALYPPAVINTQHCYSEPYAYFILLFFLNACFDSSTEKRRSLFSWFLVGLLAGLTMLVKPIFVLIPPIVGAYFVFLALKEKRKLPFLQFIPLAVGLIVFLGPWLWFTHAVSGHYSLFVSRAPSFNLYLGNQLATDGWRAWPEPELISSDTGRSLNAIIEQATSKPLKFIALELKKLSRLWVGVWNEYQFSLFGISLETQTIWHDLLLLLGGIGTIVVLLGEKPFSHKWNCASVLGSIIGLHYIYCAFEPISRYNITAMPAVILFAAFAISHAKANRLLLPAAITCAYAVLLFTLLSHTYDLKPTFAGLLAMKQISLLPWTIALAWLGLFVLLIGLTNYWLGKAINNAKLTTIALVPIFLLSGLVTIACLATDPSWREWCHTLKSDAEKIEQAILLPPLSGKPSSTSYILVDLTSTASLPPVVLTLNKEEQLHPALPWAIVRNIDPSALEVLSIQGLGMGKDLKTFRQWWAFPVPTSALKFGANNEIVLSPAIAQLQDTLAFYGDYINKPKNRLNLPSLDRISWPKGFATYDHLDSRIYEPVELLGQVNGMGQGGKQYRVRIAVPFGETHTVPEGHYVLPAVELTGKDKPRALTGSNLPTMMLTPKSLPLPTNLPSGSLFYFYCDIKGYENPGNAYVSVDFTGLEDGKPAHWNSIWQPAAITTYPDWRPASFADIIPDKVLYWKDLQVSILASPFTPDQLFMKRKEALKKDAVIRDVNFAILPPLEIPANPEWRIY